MNIFLNDKSSLQLLRCAYRNQGLALAPVDVKRPSSLPLTSVRLNNLQIPEVLSLLQAPEKGPLGLLVPNDSKRIRSQGIQSSICSHPRGDHPFLLLTHSDTRMPSPIVPKEHNVFALSPGNIALGMAHRLRHLVAQNRMTPQRATLMLVKLLLELCGTFSHDPFDPLMGEVQYETKPLLCADSFLSLVAPAGHEHGLSLARSAAQFVFDKSGSPQESFMGPALFFPEKLGGLELCDFLANKPLELSDQERCSIGYRTITPDFQLVGYRSVVEYLGKIHDEGDNPRIDHTRTLDYSTLGVREFGFVYEDVRTLPLFMASASRLVTAMEQYGGREIRDRFNRRSRSESFRAKQQTLFEVFRPWLR